MATRERSSSAMREARKELSVWIRVVSVARGAGAGAIAVDVVSGMGGGETVGGDMRGDRRGNSEEGVKQGQERGVGRGRGRGRSRDSMVGRRAGEGGGGVERRRAIG